MFLLSLGATARVTRFITRDYLSRHLRIWVLKRWDEEHDIPTLLRCPWCFSVWAAAGVFSVAYFYGHTAAFMWITGALSAAYVYGLVSSLLDPLPPEETPHRE